MKIYHGSISIIKKPIYGYGNPYNDYGLGFYCTDDKELAKEWSVTYDLDGYANEYEIDLSNLKVIDLSKKPYCILNWLAILLKNRTFKSKSPLAEEAKKYILSHYLIDYSDIDVMIGYRADDSYFSFARDFISGTISYRQLTNALKLGNLGKQIVLLSKKAFEALHYIDNEPVDTIEWFPKKEKRELTAKKDYFDVNRNQRKKNDIYIINIIDEKMEANDERLQ